MESKIIKSEDETPKKKARVETPEPSPPITAVLPNCRGWVEYLGEVDIPHPPLFQGLAGGIRALLEQIHPGVTITDDAVGLVAQMMRIICEKMVVGIPRRLAVVQQTTFALQDMESLLKAFHVHVNDGEFAEVRHAQNITQNVFCSRFLISIGLSQDGRRIRLPRRF